MTPAEVPVELRERTFEAVLFDWDGTAVPDRDADVMEARARGGPLRPGPARGTFGSGYEPPQGV